MREPENRPEVDNVHVLLQYIVLLAIPLEKNALNFRCIKCVPWVAGLMKSSLLVTTSFPINMPLCASTGPVLGRWWQHRTSTGRVLAHNGMFMGIMLVYILSTQSKFKNIKLESFPCQLKAALEW